LTLRGSQTIFPLLSLFISSSTQQAVSKSYSCTTHSLDLSPLIRTRETLSKRRARASRKGRRTRFLGSNGQSKSTLSPLLSFMFYFISLEILIAPCASSGGDERFQSSAQVAAGRDPTKKERKKGIGTRYSASSSCVVSVCVSVCMFARVCDGIKSCVHNVHTFRFYPSYSLTPNPRDVALNYSGSYLVFFFESILFFCFLLELET
jgi:hypothetical protein